LSPSSLLSVPAKANSPTAVQSNTSHITLQWEPVKEGPIRRRYKVAWRSVRQNVAVSHTFTYETSTTAYSLGPNRAYAFIITPINAAGYGGNSDEVYLYSGKNLKK